MPTRQTESMKHIVVTVKLDAESTAILENTKTKLSDVIEEWCQKQSPVDIVPRGKISKRTSTTVSVNCLNILKQKANELGISVNTLINNIVKAVKNESNNS